MIYITIFGLILISIYPIVNYFIIVEFRDNGKINAKELYDLYYPLVYLTNNYAPNYIGVN